MGDDQKQNWLAVTLSVCAAAFGVQSRKNLDQDFSRSTVIPFIVAGLVFTVVFILAVYAVVKMVVPES